MKSRFPSIVAAVLLAIMTIGTSSDTFAQARPSSRGSFIGGDPFGLIWGYALSVQYESRISQDNSWALRVALFPSIDAAIGVGASYRFYIADGRALTGLNVAPSIDAIFGSAGSLSYSYFSVGGDLAYKWIFDGGFGVEPYLSIRNNFVLSKYGNSALTGFRPGIGVWLGFAW
jgi:hypothetical protein